MTKDEIIYLLEQLEDYMDDRSDVADDNGGEDYIPRPNKEMSFLNDIREAIDSLKKQKS